MHSGRAPLIVETHRQSKRERERERKREKTKIELQGRIKRRTRGKLELKILETRKSKHNTIRRRRGPSSLD
jgi:hypothetical protein